ncbi:uncharacterized protein EI90DRAFT_96916 [Cantharellus anzutake]|uniref:uncharacterized protein n=1 Tax=Cantharellus anzutake TaxID=1750568 RepID=UPI0019051257|nr:uncharacterized protein EI90DRAFT_96916 [Cantharellus anzutake]KAF8336983.1 hypothetical protein EI90DRAFT_96916 [Cantharellus anzutake]
MPPRGSQGYDFSPIFSHYILQFTFILALVGWFTAFIGQTVATANYGHKFVGPAWFAIFLQLFLTAGVVHTIATDSIAMHRFQIAVFSALAIALAVIIVDTTIYASVSSLQATGAGWMLIAMADILWCLFFTSEEDSLQLHLFNYLGTGGLTSPGRHRRRTTVRSDTLGGGIGNNYGSYGGGVGNTAVGLGAPMNGVRSNSMVAGNVSKESGTPGGANQTTPLITGGPLGDTSAGSITNPANQEQGSETEPYAYKAKALYAYTASPDDPNEISFSKGEILEILDNAGKWWQSRKADGSRGIAPSNYLQII